MADRRTEFWERIHLVGRYFRLHVPQHVRLCKNCSLEISLLSIRDYLILVGKGRVQYERELGNFMIHQLVESLSARRYTYMNLTR